MTPRQLMTIRAVEPLEGHNVRLQFSDGTWKTVDLGPYLHGPVFEPLRADPDAFRAVRVDPELGTIVWPNGADMDPDVLYYELKPAWMEDANSEQRPQPAPTRTSPHRKKA
jgi:hypothetical protein